MKNLNALKDIAITNESQPAYEWPVDHGNVDNMKEKFAESLQMVMANAGKETVRVTRSKQVGKNWERQGDLYWTNDVKLVEDEGLVKVYLILSDGTQVKLPADSQRSEQTQIQVYDDNVNRGLIVSWDDENGERQAISLIPDKADDYVLPEIPEPNY